MLLLPEADATSYYLFVEDTVGTLFRVSTRLLSPLLWFTSSLEYCSYVPEERAQRKDRHFDDGHFYTDYDSF
jgi:hypothetical protein